jgi:predicted esterase
MQRAHSLAAGLLCCLCSIARAESSAETFEYVATPASLLPAEQLAGLSEILPPDQEIRWKLFVPSGAEPSGVLVFVHPTATAEPRAGWTHVLQQQRLIWVSAEDFGNSQPSAQRVLVALLGLAHAQQAYSVDAKRIYIAGMSGGGRIASKTITKFPRMFTGAIYIVGADPLDDEALAQRELIAAKRYVFLTGHQDFNRREMRSIHRRYGKAGVKDALWLDLPALGHEYPSPAQLERAIRFLDTGVDAHAEAVR